MIVIFKSDIQTLHNINLKTYIGLLDQLYLQYIKGRNGRGFISKQMQSIIQNIIDK